MKRLSEAEIQSRLVPTRQRWPDANTNTEWGKLHAAVDALHDLVTSLENNCRIAEDDSDLTVQGIARRRAVIGQQALAELKDFAPYISAEKAANNTTDVLEGRMTELPKPPTTYAEVAEAEEIRAFIRQQKSPIDFIFKHLSNPRVVRAVLTADAFLTGLSDTEHNLVRERARAALHPVPAETQQRMAKALDELRAGVEAARRMVLERL